MVLAYVFTHVGVYDLLEGVLGAEAVGQARESGSERRACPCWFPPGCI